VNYEKNKKRSFYETPCSNLQQRRAWVEKVGESKKMQFSDTLQICDRITIYSCEFTTDLIMCAQNFNFAFHFPENGGFSIKLWGIVSLPRRRE